MQLLSEGDGEDEDENIANLLALGGDPMGLGGGKGGAGLGASGARESPF